MVSAISSSKSYDRNQFSPSPGHALQLKLERSAMRIRPRKISFTFIVSMNECRGLFQFNSAKTMIRNALKVSQEQLEP